MLEFLKKKKNKEENASGDVPSEETKQPTKTKETSKTNASSSNLSSGDLERIKVEIEKIKASVDAFGEIRESFGERFNHLSENLGELRQMILDRDKTMQEIELKSIKAYDMVNTVQPEKTMVEMQKQEAKIEALNANLEGNETIMGKIMEELKEAKRKIEFFRGVEEIVKLSEETKKELVEIKKVEAKININADKVETLYSELRNKFQRIDLFDSELKEMKVTSDQNLKDIGMLKEKAATLATKDELDTLVQKVKRYIDLLKELEKKSSMTNDIDKLRNILESLK